jgi:hypothetical protein
MQQHMQPWWLQALLQLQLLQRTVLISVRPDGGKNQRALLNVLSCTDQSAESLHTQVQWEVRKSNGAAAVDISYRAGMLGLSVSLGDVLKAARGELVHPSLAPQDGVLVVTASVDLLPDQLGASSRPTPHGKSTVSRRRSDHGYSAIQKVVHLVYPKEPMSKDNVAAKELEEKGKGAEWQVQPRVPPGVGAARKFTVAYPSARLVWTALVMRSQKVSTDRSNPLETSRKHAQALGK